VEILSPTIEFLRAAACFTSRRRRYARRWFVDIFIILPDDGSMHRADYANAMPHLQLFSYVCTRDEHEQRAVSLH